MEHIDPAGGLAPLAADGTKRLESAARLNAHVAGLPGIDTNTRSCGHPAFVAGARLLTV